jgi:hypothetical protein
MSVILSIGFPCVFHAAEALTVENAESLSCQGLAESNRHTSGLGGQVGVQLFHKSVCIGAVGRTGIRKRLGGGVRAAKAVHAVLHKDTGGAAVHAQHLPDGHFLVDCRHRGFLTFNTLEQCSVAILPLGSGVVNAAARHRQNAVGLQMLAQEGFDAQRRVGEKTEG